jgi:biopolymer transport protein TolQ
MQPVNWVQLVAQQSENSASEGTVWTILGEASGMVLAVLVLLILASIASWFLIFLKWRQIKRATEESDKFTDEFFATDRFDALSHEAEKYKDAPTAAVFTNGYEELRRVVDDDGYVDQNGLGNVERALRKSANEEMNEQERYLTFLATVGSTAPFVGLFGTVWGIMTAFMDISAEGTAGLDVVAGPIAEALIATAIGLLAAIPAVMAFNLFNASVESLRMKVEGFMNDFMNVVERSLLR